MGILDIGKLISKCAKSNLLGKIGIWGATAVTTGAVAVGAFKLFSQIPEILSGVNEFDEYNQTPEGRKKYSYYKKIEDACSRVGISMEDAMRNKIFENVAGVKSFEDLANLSEAEIDKTVQAIDDSFGWVRNFGKRFRGFLDFDMSNQDIQELIQDAKMKKIMNREGISNFQQLWFNMWHGGFDSTLEDYVSDGNWEEAGIKYFSTKLGTINGLSDAEKSEKYKDLRKEYFLRMQKMGNKNTEGAERAMAASIQVLKADDRVVAAKDLITTGKTDFDVNRRALYVQRNAVANLTQLDAFGCAPSAHDATEYHHTTFSHMDENGVRESAQQLMLLSSQTESEYQLLANKINSGTATPNELARFEYLKLLRTNCVIAGNAGAMTGTLANGYISSGVAYETAGSLYKNAEAIGISNEVLSFASEFLSNSSDIPASLKSMITAKLDTVTGGAYSAVIKQNSSTEESGSNDKTLSTVNNDEKNTTEQNKDITADNTKPDEEKPDNENTTLNCAGERNQTPANSYTTNPFNNEHSKQKYAKTENGKKSLPEQNHNEQEFIPPQNGLNPKNIDNIVCNNNIRSFIEYVRENYDLTESIKLFMNNSNNKKLHEKAAEWFDTLPDGLKEITFDSINRTEPKKLLAASLTSKQLEKHMKTMDTYTKTAMEPILQKKKEAESCYETTQQA